VFFKLEIAAAEAFVRGHDSVDGGHLDFTTIERRVNRVQLKLPLFGRHG
jgi:hypothetical protein